MNVRILILPVLLFATSFAEANLSPFEICRIDTSSNMFMSPLSQESQTALSNFMNTPLPSVATNPWTTGQCAATRGATCAAGTNPSDCDHCIMLALREEKTDRLRRQELEAAITRNCGNLSREQRPNQQPPSQTPAADPELTNRQQRQAMRAEDRADAGTACTPCDPNAVCTYRRRGAIGRMFTSLEDNEHMICDVVCNAGFTLQDGFRCIPNAESEQTQQAPTRREQRDTENQALIDTACTDGCPANAQCTWRARNALGRITSRNDLRCAPTECGAGFTLDGNSCVNTAEYNNRRNNRRAAERELRATDAWQAADRAFTEAVAAARRAYDEAVQNAMRIQ